MTHRRSELIQFSNSRAILFLEETKDGVASYLAYQVTLDTPLPATIGEPHTHKELLDIFHFMPDFYNREQFYEWLTYFASNTNKEN